MPTVRVEIEDYDDDSESVSKEKEIINVAHFVPDTKKKPEQIRATCGPHVGQRIRLKLAPFDDDDLGEKKKAIVRTSSVLRFVVANGVQIESEIHPKLPDDFDGGESFSRQFGTLKQHGVALQVRFKPVGHTGVLDDDGKKGKRKIEKLTIGKANTLYEICDGAITIDKMSLAASITTSRVADAAKPFVSVNDRDAEDRQIARSVEFYEKKQGRFGLRSQKSEPNTRRSERPRAVR